MTQIQKAPSGRVRRQPVGTRNRLSITGQEPGYVYRIVSDTSDRISQMEAAGYEFVPADQVKVGDSRINQPKGQGEKATVSIGGGVVGYVMRQKQEWYEEDQAAKRAEVARTMESMKRVNKSDGEYGSVKIGSSAE